MRAVTSLLLIALWAGCGDDDVVHDQIPDAGPADALPCSTRITYASTWLRPAGHSESFDVVEGDVTWDGTCTDDGTSSYATLSNGWKPYFTGHQACAIALDPAPSCESFSELCSTRITYGAAWSPPPMHSEQYDEVPGRVFWDGKCTNTTADSYGALSNGWQPHFTATNACEMSFRWQGCGGLYKNPSIPTDCPDPGVAFEAARYVLTCTSGNAANAFPLYVSTDLITWTPTGHIFSPATKPAWAVSDFWAPEIHDLSTPNNPRWVAYFTARGADGKLAIGAATAPDILGPYTPQPAPLVHSNAVGLIDATHFTDGTTHYLIWKEDGNAQNQPTPIKASALSPDGVALVGSPVELIRNDQTWEGNLVEAPWILVNGGYYLFYSGNAYYDGRYAVGVARASSPLGPYTKYGNNPVVKSTTDWVGPGHCSVVLGPGSLDLPSGDAELGWYMVYHAWQAGHVNGPGDGRMVLVDQIQLGSDGWPHVYGAPSSSSRPTP